MFRFGFGGFGVVRLLGDRARGHRAPCVLGIVGRTGEIRLAEWIEDVNGKRLGAESRTVEK
jgi:hypothetical protein